MIHSTTATCVLLLAAGGALAGNITVDNTLRAANAGRRLAGPIYGLDENSGRLAGRNLLISLKNFDLDAGETALFFSGQSVKNVITRVTGGTASRINGAVVSRIEGANLFLINPSGLLIGPTATFEISGALHLSTAEALDFADGARLDTRGGDVPTLSAAEPVAFGFLGVPKPISVTGATIAPPPGGTPRNVYSLTGGDLTIRGGNFAARNGVIALHAGGGPGRVTVPTIDGGGLATFARRGRVTVADRASLDAANSGLIRVTGRDVTFDNARADALASAQDGRSIDVTADATLRIDNGAVISGGSEGAGDSPPINLSADRIVVDNRGTVASRLSAIDANAPSGNAGAIALTAGDVLFRAQGNVQTSTGTASQGANVNVVATRSLGIEGSPVVGRADALVLTGVQTETTGPAGGAGGDIRVRAARADIVQTGILQARSVGSGPAGAIDVTGGDLTLDARDFGYTGIASRVGENAATTGDSGDVTVDLSGDLSIRRGGAISASTFAAGNGGNVNVSARNVRATQVGIGNIDDLTGEPFNGVFARSAVRDETATDGGRAGSVTITATGEIVLSGSSQAAVNAVRSSSGAGDVTLTAPRVTIDTGGRVTARSTGGGGGGDVRIEGRRIDVRGDGPAVVEDQNGDADGTQITARSDGAGGNVTLRGRTIVVSGGALLSANAAGDGGAFTIAPAGVLVLGGSSTINAVAEGRPVQTMIDPSATFVRSPTATINAQNPVLPPDVDVTAGLLTFDVTFADSSRRLQEDCLSQGLSNFSSFAIEPRGGVVSGAGR